MQVVKILRSIIEHHEDNPDTLLKTATFAEVTSVAYDDSHLRQLPAVSSLSNRADISIQNEVIIITETEEMTLHVLLEIKSSA